MLKHPRFFLLRRIPISLLSLIIGIPCGLLAWVILEQVQPDALQEIFIDELNVQLDQYARETLSRYENQVRTHVSVTRLLANHRLLANYLKAIQWDQATSSKPLIHQQPPPWLPDSKLWQSLVRPSHLILTDLDGNFREIYLVTGTLLPAKITKTIGFLFSYNEKKESQKGQTHLTVIDEQLYQLVNEPVVDLSGNYAGSLLLFAPVHEAYLEVISPTGVISAVVDTEQRLLASSNKTIAPLAADLNSLAHSYVVTTQSFFLKMPKLV